MTPPQLFRALTAEAIASAIAMYTDPELRLTGIEPDEIRKRAALKVQMDPELKMLLTGTINTIEQARDNYSDYRINQLLQDGVHTMNAAGREMKVEVTDTKIKVSNVLTGTGLDVSDGAFVIFVDSMAATGTALKRWEALTSDDTRVMIIPLRVPDGKSITDVVAAKRQDDTGFAV